LEDDFSNLESFVKWPGACPQNVLYISIALW